MRYLYFPGCSLKATGKPYEESLLPVFARLGVEMPELGDWSCCGATTYMGVSEVQAFALAARNLALAKQAETDEPVTLIAPCNACYLVLSKAQHYMKEYPDITRRVARALEEIGLSYEGHVPVRHPLDVLINDVGLDAIKKRVTRPLQGMKIAPYYGCQMVRPYSTFDDQQNPKTMDQILRVLGAEIIDWPLKTRCCGGSLMGTVQDAGMRMTYVLLKEARRCGADMVATCCPLCQHNLECYQDKITEAYGSGAEAPVAYFTQFMGLAMGLSSRELGVGRLMKPIPAQAVAV